MNNIIEIKDLKKIYNDSEVAVHALNGVDLAFQQGEFAAIVGPSGSGKTTLLNMIGGLDEPSEGGIQIYGVNIGKLSSRKLINFRLKNIGFVFQSYNLI
ncbi:MAG: ATP-binding cassette domain-containing protein, partial [Bacteroidia bacterium]|nr:ATP-binding cassette domain-containing protein [Bacteroidia bacterium]